jgi:hypothetical protein
MTMLAHCARGLLFAVAVLCTACSREAPPAATVAPAKDIAATTAPSPKATADGAVAARAYAQSRGLAPTTTGAVAPEKPLGDDGYVELDWLKMMPKEDLDALKNPAPVQHVGRVRMAQFGTFNTVAEVTGHKIKLPGYVVPIESDDQGRMTEFFFVPFFGACIHVPPPPPNQLVYAKLAQPIKTPQIWDPYWLRGELRVETVKNQIAGSAYTMVDAELVPYDG